MRRIFVFFLIFFSGCGYAASEEDYIYKPPVTPQQNIRVAISTSGFESLVHESVEITATGAGGFSVSDGGDITRIRRFGAGEVFAACRTQGDIFYVVPHVGGKLEIIGLWRNWADGENPRFRGVLEIHVVEGGFIIINELCIEQYLYAVVPSEMPSGFGVEASKVQAITARSFAVHQRESGAFAHIGAHVCDTIMSQVYNNIPENDISIEAVRATRGMVLMYGGEIALANYFSTSGGTTANFGEVWARGGEFPTHTPSFLRARPQFNVKDYNAGDLRCENTAAVFFRNTDINAFDAQFPWFRWNVTLSREDLAWRVNPSIGEITDMRVLRRGQGGNIMELEFIGTGGSSNVLTEFNIRTVLNPADIPVIRHDGTSVSNLSLLPSAFFTFDIHRDENLRLQYVVIYGGGNGHGVGMSQNGVRALLDMGLDYRQIIAHYYPGTVIADYPLA